MLSNLSLISIGDFAVLNKKGVITVTSNYDVIMA
jgi:hypothetical protein